MARVNNDEERRGCIPEVGRSKLAGAMDLARNQDKSDWWCRVVEKLD